MKADTILASLSLSKVHMCIKQCKYIYLYIAPHAYLYYGLSKQQCDVGNTDDNEEMHEYNKN